MNRYLYASKNESAPIEDALIQRQAGKLELSPQQLVIDIVVELYLARLYNRTEQASATICRSLFQVGVAPLHILTQQLCRPLCFAEVFERCVDVIRQITLRLSQVIDLRRLSVKSALED